VQHVRQLPRPRQRTRGDRVEEDLAWFSSTQP
jgi:hypothetical protein